MFMMAKSQSEENDITTQWLKNQETKDSGPKAWASHVNNDL